MRNIPVIDPIIFRLASAALLLLGATGAQAAGLEVSGSRVSELFEADGPRREAVMPVSLIWEKSGWRARMTLPYDLFRDGDDRDARNRAGAVGHRQDRLHPSMGNATVTLSRAVDLGGGVLLDLAGEMKLPTAQAERRYGTGRLGSLVEANLSALTGRWSLWTTATRHFQSATSLMPLRDNWDGRVGAAYAIDKSTELSLEGNYWQSPWQGDAGSHDLTLTFSRDAGRRDRFEAYATYGFTGYYSGVTAALSWRKSLGRR